MKRLHPCEDEAFPIVLMARIGLCIVGTMTTLAGIACWGETALYVLGPGAALSSLVLLPFGLYLLAPIGMLARRLWLLLPAAAASAVLPMLAWSMFRISVNVPGTVQVGLMLCLLTLPPIVQTLLVVRQRCRERDADAARS